MTNDKYKITVDEACRRLGSAGYFWRSDLESIADSNGMVDCREANRLPVVKNFREDLANDLETAYIDQWNRVMRCPTSS